MSVSRWVIAVAFGVILASHGVCGQNAGNNGNNANDTGTKASYQSEPSEPFSIPVRIIEDKESTEASQPGEQDSRDLQKRDLIAQEGMNRATQSIEDATWLMLWATIASVFFVAIGTFLLVWTLRLTREANKAARDAVEVTREIGEAQVRAYVNVERAEVTGLAPNGRLRFYVNFKNTGATPAKNFQIRSMVGFKPGSIKHLKVRGLTEIDSLPGIVASDGSAFIDVTMEQPITDMEYSQIKSAGLGILIAGFVSYDTVFGQRKRTVFKMTNVGWTSGGGPIIGPCGKNNRSN